VTNVCCPSFIKNTRASRQDFPRALFRFAHLFRFALVNFTFYFLTLFSKFYFNFPSQYLFAIGLAVVFLSVRSHLPSLPNFHISVPRYATLKKEELFWRKSSTHRKGTSYETFTLHGLPFQGNSRPSRWHPLPPHKLQFKDSQFRPRFQFCA